MFDIAVLARKKLIGISLPAKHQYSAVKQGLGGHGPDLQHVMLIMLKSLICGSNSVGRVRPCQGRCRGFESRLPLQNIQQFARENPIYRRGSQVVRQRSAKPLFVGSIPTRASKESA